MRLLYIDIDSLRPDHLGCYGYHRATSPNIDRIAAEGVRFDRCYASDVPCLPSRSALFCGRHGIHNGVINHGGAQSEPFPDGISRGFRSRIGQTSWMAALRGAGLRTATVSSFGERHSAFHWYSGFNDVANSGFGGIETADQVFPLAKDWLERHGKGDDWFLHVNFWDPHTPYRTPAAFGNPFAADPTPAWLTEDVRRGHWAAAGPHSAREVLGFGAGGDYERMVTTRYPLQPAEIASMDDVRRMFDGYDRGVRYADDYVGRVLNVLADQGVLDDTVVMVSADHGENLGELNIYGDHQTADEITSRVPLIVRWPGVTDGQAGRADRGLHYQFDWAATTLELLGRPVPEVWDGRSFAPALRAGRDDGREFLVLSQGAWSCQRGVRWDDWLCLRSYHDGYHGFPDAMLFNVADDPHEQRDLAAARPDVLAQGLALLDRWQGEMMATATDPTDPMRVVLSEGGPLHTRGELPRYLERLRATGRAAWAERLAAAHPREAAGA